MTRQNIVGVLLALSDQLPACRRFVRHVIEPGSGREQA